MKSPIPASYWIIPKQFAAGEYPGGFSEERAAAKVAALESAGIDCFIDLTSPENRLKPYNMCIRRAEYYHHPLPDFSIPRCPSDMRAVLDRIDSALGRGRIVYIHCLGGVGRTGTAVGCWLVRHGRSGKEALAELKALFRSCSKSCLCDTPETQEQESYILAWADSRKPGIDPA